MRRFTRSLIVALAAIAFGYAAARVAAPLLAERTAGPGAGADSHLPAEPVAATDGAAANSSVRSVAGSGDDVVARVLAALERRPNIAAKLRQSIFVDGRAMHGAGEYWQQGVLNQRRTRWQWQSVSNDRSVTFRQMLTEGRYLWTERRSGERNAITRVDVSRLGRELGVGARDPDADAKLPIWQADPRLLVRGGLSQLVAELLRGFSFDSPAELADQPGVVALIGRWRGPELTRLCPGLTVDAIDWPSRLPHHVLLTIGQQDLFPYLVEYRTGEQAALATNPLGLRPAAEMLSRIEFYEVQFAAAMPSELFEFRSAEVDWHDVTAAAIQRLRAVLPPPPVAATPVTTR